MADAILSDKENSSASEQVQQVTQSSTKMRLPNRADLVKRTSDALGIIRKPETIRQFQDWLSTFDYHILDQTCTNRHQIETANLCLVAETIANAALARTQSLGAHYLLPEE